MNLVTLIEALMSKVNYILLGSIKYLKIAPKNSTQVNADMLSAFIMNVLPKTVSSVIKR